MNNKSLGALKVLLVTLITATAITGISILDDHLWNLIIAGIGIAAYAIVGFFCSLHIVSSREAGKAAFAIVFIILLVIGFFIYQGILNFEQWIVSWPVVVKVSLITILTAGVIAIIIVLLLNSFSKKGKANEELIDKFEKEG